MCKLPFSILSLINEDQLSTQGAKRPRSGAEDSYIQAGNSNSGFTGVTNDQSGSQWDWDDDERGVGMVIQALLSEFGDFGDFFENEALPFGEVLSLFSLVHYLIIYLDIFSGLWHLYITTLSL